MCITSCIPDDTPDKGNAIVCINTASLCEKLGIADLVAGMLAEKASFKITDSVLVYDRQGQLVAWQTTTTGTEPFWLLMEAEQLATVQEEVEPMGSVVDLIIDGLTPECDYGNVSLAVEGNGVQSSESQHRIQYRVP